jgi:class 3 adenylate cyclase
MSGIPHREVKQGTALIADVVNFYRQQPESLEATADVLDDLYSTIANTVQTHRGEIMKWMGDGVLACFWGDDHARRAVYTAVGLHEEFEAFAARHGFSDSGLTISVATGEMIRGEFGTGTSRHEDVFGEPVNCTATIMPEASGTITLCEATYDAVSGLVEVDKLVEHVYYGPLFALKSLKA